MGDGFVTDDKQRPEMTAERLTELRRQRESLDADIALLDGDIAATQALASVSETTIEVQRVEGFDSGTIACLRCGKRIDLFFNGGELDRKACCGLVYRTEHVRIDLVIEEAAADE